MRMFIPVAALVLALAAPAFAQDDDGFGMEEMPGLERFQDGFGDLMDRVERILRPLLEQLQDTLRELMSELEAWMQESDPGQMFGEFDFRQWMEELQRMMEGLQPLPEGEEEY